MCVVSMIMEEAYKFPWERPTIVTTPSLPNHWTYFDNAQQKRNDELAKLVDRLLEKAADYDKRTGQPDCPDAEKKVKLLKLANELGVRIHFPDEVEEGSDPSECRQN